MERINAKELIAKIRESLRDDQIRMYAILGAAVFLSLIYISVFIIPAFVDFFKASSKANEENNKISLLNVRVKKLREMDKVLKSLEKEYRDYESLLPDQKEIPSLLKELSVMAKGSDVTIKSIVPGKIVTKKGEKYYSEMPVVIAAKSGYHQLGTFISDLEQADRFLSIENVRIVSDRKTPRMHNIKIVVKTYVAIENEKI